MSARLVTRHPDGTIRSTVIESAIRIGSAASSDLKIEDASVSALHAKVLISDGDYVIEEAKGGTGTLVNGAAVTRRPLRHLDVISLGNGFDIVFLTSPDAKPAPAPAPAPAPVSVPVPNTPAAAGTIIGAVEAMTPPKFVEDHGETAVGAAPVAVPNLDAGAGTRLVNVSDPPVELQQLLKKVREELFPDGPVPERTITGAPMSTAPPVFEEPVEEKEESLPETVLGVAAAITRLRLVGSSGTFEVPIGEATVGRSITANVRIDSREVSRVHTKIIVTPTEVVVDDQKSANGTTVNGQVISAPHRLADGDLISFATFEFRVTIVRLGGK